MARKRTTDLAPITHFRSDRISIVNGQYYFDTREGVLKGPYATREEAQRAVEEYILKCQLQERQPLQSSLVPGATDVTRG